MTTASKILITVLAVWWAFFAAATLLFVTACRWADDDE